jgi:chemotaxis protein MotD
MEMTRVDLTPPGSSPAGETANGGRCLELGGSFDEADAGFLQQLAAVAADDDASGCAPRPKDAVGPVIARWWQRQTGTQATTSQVPEPDVLGAATAELASAPMAGIDAQATILVAPAVDPRSGGEPEPQGTDNAEPGDGDDLGPPATNPATSVLARVGDSQPMTAPPLVMPTSILVAAPAGPHAMPAIPIERLQRPAQSEPLPPAAKDSAAEAAVRTVTVVRSETHFAPVLRVAPMPPASKPVLAERVGAADNRKPDPPVERPKLARLDPSAPRGQVREHSLAQSAPIHSDADTAQSGLNDEDATLTAPLPARGLVHTTQPASSPAQQIADKIAAELPPAGADSPRAASATTPRPAALQPVKVLTIQLHPADLGTVTVRMTLKAEAMDVQVEVGRRSTARLIDADRDTLTSLLRSAGYNVEGLTVRTVEAPNAASSPGPTQGAPDSGPQLQPGGSQPDARASGGRAQPEPRGHTQVPDRNSNDSEQASGDRPRAGAGLYV